LGGERPFPADAIESILPPPLISSGGFVFLHGKHAGLVTRDVQGPTRFFFFFSRDEIFSRSRPRRSRDSVGKFNDRRATRSRRSSQADYKKSANFCNSRSRLPHVPMQTTQCRIKRARLLAARSPPNQAHSGPHQIPATPLLPMSGALSVCGGKKQRRPLPPASTGVHVSPTPEQKLQAGQRHAAPDGPVKIRAAA
jgi:hypothetical protein